MTCSKLFAFAAIALCATSAVAAGGQNRQFLPANGFNPRPSDRNADVGNEQRQQQESAPTRERNEGFGYGFERRQERSDRPDSGRRGRN